MLESTRLACLQAMGIQAWALRQALPGVPARIAPQWPEFVLPQEPQAQPPSAPEVVAAVPAAAPAIDALRARLQVAGSRPVELPSKQPALKSGATDSPVIADEAIPAALPAITPFRVELWSSGSTAVLLEAPGFSRSREFFRSPQLDDLLRVLELSLAEPLAAFHWPISQSPLLDRSALAASEALQTFVASRLEGRGVSQLLCLGRGSWLVAHSDIESLQLGALAGPATLPGQLWLVEGLELLAQAGGRQVLWQQLQDFLLVVRQSHG